MEAELPKNPTDNQTNDAKQLDNLTIVRQPPVGWSEFWKDAIHKNNDIESEVGPVSNNSLKKKAPVDILIATDCRSISQEEFNSM